MRAATKCKQCKEKLGESMVRVPAGAFCCYQCAMDFAKLLMDKKAAKKSREDAAAKRAEDRERRSQAAKERREMSARKESLKSRSQLTKDAQVEFNAFIRERDINEPCISCGAWPDASEWTVGGVWDCGHYLSVGSHPELRFNEDNAHKQCKRCNGGAGRFAARNRTVSQQYRVNLILKIGIERVEALEGPHEPAKYTADELREIRSIYKEKLKALVDQR